MSRLRSIFTAAVASACAAIPAAALAQPSSAPPESFYDFTGRFMGPEPGPNAPRTPIANPVESTPEVLHEGRRLFIWFNCYGCHGGRAGGGMGPSLRDAEWRYGASDEAIFRSIAEGRQFGMPAWGTKLPPEQLWQITAYIRSMGSPKEPDPPPANPSVLNPPAPALEIEQQQAHGETHASR
jgi:cytochrome c oxidase cbb3-type subunit 3